MIKVSAASRVVFFYASCQLNFSEPTVSLLLHVVAVNLQATLQPVIFSDGKILR